MSHPLGALDEIWLRLDAPENPLVITGVMWFDAPVPGPVIEQLLRERLIEPYPKFRHRITRPAVGPAWWEPDPHFDLGHHLHFASLPEPGDEAALQALVAELMSVPLDLSMPPWQFHLVHGYRGGAALVGRIHHSLVDGVTLARLLPTLSDEHNAIAPRDDDPKSTWARGVDGLTELLSHPEKLAGALRMGAEGAAELERLLVMPFEAQTPLRGKLTTRKTCAWTPPLSLAEVKAIGSRTGCTVNDVLVSAMADALGRYLRERDAGVTQLRFMVPVDLRPQDLRPSAALGNHFSLVVLPLPTGVKAPLVRLGEVHAAMQAHKEGAQAATIWSLFNAVAQSPAAVERWFFDIMGRKGTGVFTNVKGPPAPLSFYGHRVDGILVWVPQAGPMGIGLSIFSYAGEVSVGVAGDAALLEEPQALAQHFVDAFDDLSST